MKKIRKRKINRVIISLSLLFFLCSCSKEYKANKLFDEAVQLVISAQTAEKTSYLEAYEKYKQALVNIKTILLNYPETQLAGKIQNNEVQIGPLDYKSLEENTPLFQKKAEGEKDPFSCALYLVNKIGRPDRKNLYLSQIARDQAAFGKKDEAFQLIGQIDSKSRERYWEDLADFYIKTGKYGLAGETAEKIDSKYFKTEILNRIALAYLESGQTEPALKLLSYAYSTNLSGDDRFFMVMGLNEIATSFARAGQRQQALDIFSQAVEMGNKIGHEWQDKLGDQRLEETVTAYASLGFFERITDTVNMIQASFFRQGAWDGVFRECLKSNRLELALKYSETMNPDGKANRLSALAIHYAQSGDFSHAVNLVEKIKTLSFSYPGQKSQIIFETLVKIAIQYAEHGEIEKALEMVRSAQAAAPTYWVGDAFIEIARVAAEHGELEKSRDLINSLRYPSEQDRAWLMVASILAKKGDYAQAIQIFDKTGECYKEHGTQLERCQLDSRRSSSGLSTFRKDYQEQKNRVGSELCQFLIKSNQLDKANSLAMQIPGIDSQYPDLTEVVREYARTGEYLKAFQILESVPSSSFTIPALSAIAVEYARAGKQPDPEVKAILHSLLR